MKVENKKVFFFYQSEGMENCKMSGKIREKSGNFEMDDKWQPCNQVILLGINRLRIVTVFLWS